MMHNKPSVWCVRAYQNGPHAIRLVEGNYIAIGWFEDLDLANATISDRNEIYELYQYHHPEDTSPNVIGQQVGQIHRFLLEIQPGDFVLTPTYEPAGIYWGIVQEGPLIYEPNSPDGCPFPHRRPVSWNSTPLQRNTFSTKFRYSLGSSLTVFKIKHANEFFERIGRNDLISLEDQEAQRLQQTYKETILDRLLTLDAKELEYLATELLRTLGFQTEHTGKSGDGGVDIEGLLDVNNILKAHLVVQVKRYEKNVRISDREVRKLRQNIKEYGYGAFITTGKFTEKALKVGTEPGFRPIGTIDGEQLVDLLTTKWDDLEVDVDNEDLQKILEKLKLKRGLVFSADD